MCSVMFSGCFVIFFKQKTAYEMRISDWSSDVGSSDLEIQEVTALAMISWISAFDGQISLRNTSLPSFDLPSGSLVRSMPVVPASACATIRGGEAREFMGPAARRVGKECVSSCRYRWYPTH